MKQTNLRDGTTLNNLLFQIFDVDPAVMRTARTKTPISASAIREIPFEWDSEAITFCIDQMTATDSLPGPLSNPRFVDDRNALRATVQQAIKEDAAGNVSPATTKHVNDVVASFRVHFLKSSADYVAGYQEALDYFTTLASLTRLLNDPSMKAFLEKLDDGEERTVGELIAFMNAHNLRFGPAMSDRQLEIYNRLVPALTAITDEPSPECH